MTGILPDANVVGVVRALINYLQGDQWQDYWESLKIVVFTFADLGLAESAPDSIVWNVCQEREVVLITANRNSKRADSLAAVIRSSNRPTSLPLFTISDLGKLRRSKRYARKVAERLLEYLLDIELYLGSGRLYLP